jgi:hypothetical protein
VPSWFEDHLACAPLADWLPALLAADVDATWIAGGVRTPGRIERLLAGVARGPSIGTIVVHTGALHAAIAKELEHAIESGGVDVLIDVAWVASAGWWRLRPWRREPVRHDAAARLGWIAAHGLGDPQQWVCTDPLPIVVTMGRRR